MIKKQRKPLVMVAIFFMLYWVIFSPNDSTDSNIEDVKVPHSDIAETVSAKPEPEAVAPEKSALKLKQQTLALLGEALRSKKVPVFTDYPGGKARKKVFFDYFRPIVEFSNKQVNLERSQIINWKDNVSHIDQTSMDKLSEITAKYYMPKFDSAKESDWDELLVRVDTVPVSLALAQGANESAWGTSRFARKGNNYYGQWCFSKGCGLVPLKRGSGEIHEVAKFANPADSVASYIKNINRHNAYKDLRKIRAKLRESSQPITGNALAEGLGHYSERGDAYIKELQSMIRFNKLGKYDLME